VLGPFQTGTEALPAELFQKSKSFRALDNDIDMYGRFAFKVIQTGFVFAQNFDVKF
jgi:hypothetical protein